MCNNLIKWHRLHSLAWLCAEIFCNDAYKTDCVAELFFNSLFMHPCVSLRHYIPIMKLLWLAASEIIFLDKKKDSRGQLYTSKFKNNNNIRSSFRFFFPMARGENCVFPSQTVFLQIIFVLDFVPSSIT